jgi:hypothetical protein
LAVDAFAAAQKETTDEHEKAIARATEIVVKKSQTLKYKTSNAPPSTQPSTQPQVETKKGEKPLEMIDVVAKDSRERAIKALWADEWAAAGPKIAAAKTAKTLPAIVSSVKPLGDLRFIELAATHADEKTKTALAELADHATGLITAEINTMETRVNAIQKSANEWVEKTVTVPDPLDKNKSIQTKKSVKRGLDSPGIKDLNNAIDTCQRIVPTARELADALPVDDTKLKMIVSDAQSLQQHARDVLHADYRGSVDQPVAH